MRKMRTAEEMWQFCFANDLFYEKAHFYLVAKHLQPDEYAVFCFQGLQNNVRMMTDGNFAYVFTNRRLIIGQKRLTGEIVRSIDYKDLHNVTAAGQSVVIDATKWEPNVEVLKGDAVGVQKGLAEIIPIIQQKNQEQTQGANFSGSVADELAKLKKLTDEGVMTQAEFQAQKDRLLNPAETCTDYFEDIPEEPTYTYEKKFDKAVQSNDKKAIVIRAVTFTVGAIIQLPVAIIFIHLILYHYGIVDELP
ncbi:SHOCT domain-containing protein [Ihubacter sp. rT4E-8]|uniref:SHOCT domain-containing protein n=1 Tax=Ihubacter sp. rT4E-8 TaxID=3242369 RepID=UPI003CE9D097